MKTALNFQLQPALRARQRGVFLLEALIGILIFSLGVLALVALGTVAISAQTDARSRTDAASLIDQMVGQIWMKADRTTPAALQASIAVFQHQPSPTPAAGTAVTCSFDGDASSDPSVHTWITAVKGTLPGVTDSGIQIYVDTSANAYNRISITVCWQAPADKTVRHHTQVTYIN